MTEQHPGPDHNISAPVPLKEYLAQEFPADLGELLGETRKYVQELGELPQESKEPEIRKAIRLLNEKLRTSYWALLQGVSNCRMQQEDESENNPSFPPEDILFMNCGYLSPDLSAAPSEGFLDLWQKKAPVSRYQYYRLTDYLKDLHSYYFNRPEPFSSIDMPREKKMEAVEKQAERHIKRRQALQNILLQSINQSHQTKEGKRLLDIIEKELLPHLEVTLRTQKLRYAPDREQIALREASALYEKTLQEYQKWLEELRGSMDEENHLVSLVEELSTIHEAIRENKALWVCMREEHAKEKDKRERLAKKYKGRGAPDLRLEIQEKIQHIRSFCEMSARRGRLVPDPFFSGMERDMLSLEELNRCLNAMPELDPEAFNTVRLRTRGYPRVCVVPGRGDGVYDWEEHTLLFPLQPLRSVERSVAQAFGLMRWDSDEDRELKDTYSNLKDNKNKSHTGLQEAFVKDYLLWIVKETQGYRILPKDKYRWFTWQIAKKPEF